MPFNQSQIVTIFGTAKTTLASIAATVATLQGQLQTLDSQRIQLAANGGNAAAEWLRIQVLNLGLGWIPTALAPGGAATVALSAPEPSAPRNLSLLADVRPVSSYDPSLT